MLHQVDDAFTVRHVRYRAVPRTNRTPATSSRAYQPKSARVERAGIVMQSGQLRPQLYLIAPYDRRSSAISIQLALVRLRGLPGPRQLPSLHSSSDRYHPQGYVVMSTLELFLGSETSLIRNVGARGNEDMPSQCFSHGWDQFCGKLRFHYET
jgi:hypothetical protein